TRAGFEAAVAAHPDDAEPLQALCQHLFAHGTPAEAEHALRDLIGLDPRDAAAHHNLGTLFLRTRRYGDAVRAYEESLRHRPDAPATHLYLGYALKEAGRLDRAVAAWEQALRLAPGDPSAEEELRRPRVCGVPVGGD